MENWEKARGAAAWVLIALSAATAHGQDRKSALQLSSGAFNTGKSPTQVEAGLELRVPMRLWKLDATGGFGITEKTSVWIYAGLRRDFSLGPKWVIAPGFGVALYEEGDGKDLGGTIQFRSAIDFGYRITTKARLGLTFYHLSNAGLEEVNPGSNSAVITYGVNLK